MTKKVAVVAANGKSGQLIVTEALKRGFDVTAISRSQNKTEAQSFIQKDIMDLSKEDLSIFDVVVDAFGAWTPDTFDLHTVTSQHLADLLAHTDTRLLIVGGAGSLYMTPDHTLQLIDTPEFPEAFKALAKGQVDELAALRKRDDVQWTFVSPAADFRPDGERTGTYILGGEEFQLNDKSESVISYADYAIGIVDEIERGNHLQERISLLGK